MAKPILDGSLKEPIYRKTFPDEESFKQEQQRRFELLCAKLSVEWRGPEATDWKALATLNFNPPIVPAIRINRPSTAAGRWIRSRFPLSPMRADLIAALAGLHVEVQA